MNDRLAAPLTVALVLCLVVVGFFFLGKIVSDLDFWGEADAERDPREIEAGGPVHQLRPQGDGSGDSEGSPGLAPASNAEQNIIDFLVATGLDPNALDSEALLRFSSEDAYREFLRRARALGLEVLGKIDPLRTVRVGYDSASAFRDSLLALGDDLAGMQANFLVVIPEIPPAPDDRSAAGQPVGFGDSLLQWLGAPENRSSLGAGITIAILDSGIAPHDTFNGVKITSFDLVSPDSPVKGDPVGHGTAVASLIGGTHPQAPGLAPASPILSYRVTDADGNSSSFTLAQGIVSAVDDGARIINISLGSYGDSPITQDAIAYARDRGVLIVAAAGNDMLSDVTYPARYTDVVAVGSVDAAGQQMYFSNSGPTLALNAPGYQLSAALPDNGLARFTGTSGSTPLVVGSVAAVMSTLRISDPYKAVELLSATANEAGAPGYDPNYGNGILNLGRALRSSTPSISDAAIASHYFAELGASGNDEPAMLFVVENRGTTALANVPVEITAGGVSRTHTIPSILPNAFGVVSVPVNISAYASGVPLVYQSRVALSGAPDFNPADNALSTTLTAPQPGADSGRR